MKYLTSTIGVYSARSSGGVSVKTTSSVPSNTSLSNALTGVLADSSPIFADTCANASSPSPQESKITYAGVTLPFATIA